MVLNFQSATHIMLSYYYNNSDKLSHTQSHILKSQLKYFVHKPSY